MGSFQRALARVKAGQWKTEKGALEQILFKRGQMQCAFVKKGGTAEEICFRPLHLCKGGKLFYLKKYHKGGKQHLKNIVQNLLYGWKQVPMQRNRE